MFSQFDLTKVDSFLFLIVLIYEGVTIFIRQVITACLLGDVSSKIFVICYVSVGISAFCDLFSSSTIKKYKKEY